MKILLCSDWYSGSKSATFWIQPLQILVKYKPDIGQIQSVPKFIDMSYLFHLVSILHEGGRTILWIYRHINRLINNQSLIVWLQFIRVVLRTIFSPEKNIAQAPKGVSLMDAAPACP